MTSEKVGFWSGLLLFTVMLAMPTPAAMEPSAWRVAALTLLMATWWMTQALPLTVTALMPFLALPLMDIMTAQDVAKEYYSPTLFLILGGAFLALAIERTGMHRRVALAILGRSGHSVNGLMIAFMGSTALLSMIMSNTSIALIMVPIAVAVLRAGGIKEGETDGLPGALIMGVAFAASIGGLGTLVGSPTNAIAAGLIEKQLGIQITFLDWMTYGLPLVFVGVPLCAFILTRVQNVTAGSFDVNAARESIGRTQPMSIAEKRLLPIFVLVIAAWIGQPLLEPFVPKGGITDGSIAIAGSLLLFLVPDGTGRPLLIWKEADRAPWGVIMMFGGGLALAAGITESGLATWLGTALEPLSVVHPVIIALALTGIVILITEFASNVATASGVLPVVAGLVTATGADPWLMAMAASMAASWGFMMPSGTGPNAIAWSAGHIALPKMIKAGFFLDIAGIPLIVGVIWCVGQLSGS